MRPHIFWILGVLVSRNEKILGLKASSVLPKVTKMGSIIGYRIGHNGVGVPRGHIYIY